MKWHHVADNWSAFYEAIIDRWPSADDADLDEIDGDQRAFLRYIAEIEGLETEEAREEIREWLAGEIPSDVVMDESHDDISIRNSSKYVGEGEDEYDDDARFGDDNEGGETD
ncbi:hypothetical protein [Paracoccus aerodenitrificans]|uniref:hypothetical protein n=1 Tax=Paracoccus aerodenitrificans TaxID=3017781 RepID=UPI0022F0BD94|nr:hypothetical protein [Paracoccus aerodenitrificans]WBU64998.1 hypothetical protein PAE61_06080 [Paracoccus aerodenitrificans]